MLSCAPVARSFLALALFALSCSRGPEAPGAADLAPLAPADRPPYASARALCDYLNGAREAAKAHQRYRGVPWRGAYHDTRTWPIRFVASAELDEEAQAEASRLTDGGEPRGRMHRDSSWRRPIWVEGIDSERQQIAAADQPGDWDPARDIELRSALIETNGALRLALLHHDTGGKGPVLNRIGCGVATATDGRSRWWVVLLAP